MLCADACYVSILHRFPFCIVKLELAGFQDNPEADAPSHARPSCRGLRLGPRPFSPPCPGLPSSAQHPVVHETKMDRILLCSFSRSVAAQVLTRTPFPPAFPHSSSLYSRHTGLVLSWNLPGTLPCFSVTALAVPSGCNALPSPPSSLQAKVTSSTKPALITQFKIVTPRHSQPRLYLALCLPLPSTSLSAYDEICLLILSSAYCLSPCPRM